MRPIPARTCSGDMYYGSQHGAGAREVFFIHQISGMVAVALSETECWQSILASPKSKTLA